LNKKEKRLALRMALSDKNKNNKIFLIDKIEYKDIKTKVAAELLKKLKIHSKGIAVVIGKKDDKVTKTFRNIDKLEVFLADNLNAYNVICPENIIMSKDSLEIINKAFSGK
jgi:large subunit ribosomal protein L4